MDLSSYVVDSNTFLALAVALVTIISTHWEVLEKIRDPVLYWTVIVAACGHFTYLVGTAWISRTVAGDGDFDAYFYRFACLVGEGHDSREKNFFFYF
ncbi:hypothetical protein DFJ73DRAFT_99579 [Zopfochytrium polystomum]|nr:hypothetical protein DFJ73DRAFT_99579 [Zopfochytrium polystomum]